MKEKMKKCAGKDNFQRMNYLYQIANRIGFNGPINTSRIYNKLMCDISKKTVQRINYDVKRTVCKGCKTLLIEGLTCKTRIKKKKILKHCMYCNVTKTFDLCQKQVLFTSTESSLVEMLDYSNAK